MALKSRALRTGRKMRLFAHVLALWATERAARASDAEVHASTVSFDAGRQEVVLEGDVRVDAAPFHLRSQHVRLRRIAGGPLELEGDGTLGFCPCLGTPLAIGFRGAKIAPPGDLLLDRPVLRVFDVPVLWLPAFWLRSPAKVGLLPPDLAYRATDGVFAGLGAHLPWNAGKSALDLRGGFYSAGGGVVDTRFFAPTARTHVRLDRLVDTGVFVDARGYVDKGELALSWDVDAVRGRRALLATTRLDEAARRWDRATFEGTLRFATGRVTFGATTTTARGSGFGDLGSTGPTLGVALARTTADGHATFATDGYLAALSEPASAARTIGRASAAGVYTGTLGPAVVGTSARGETSFTASSRAEASVVAALVRTRIGLPLARAFGERLVHVVEPFATAASGTRTEGALPLGIAPLSGDVPVPGSLVAAVGARSSIGDVDGSSALSVDGSVGGVSLGSGRAAQGAFVRLGAHASLVSLSGEGAALREPSANAPLLYGALRGRVGPKLGPRLLVHAAFGTSDDAFSARRLADGGADAPSTFLSARTASVGGRGVLPVARRVSFMAGADGDLAQSTFLGAFGGVELRDKCQCLVLRAFGSRRLGREGVDVWLTLDVLGDAPSP